MPKIVPRVSFKVRSSNEFNDGEICYIDGVNAWKDVSTEDLFKNKRVLVFSLPGAFTPTCSSQQLPGFEKSFVDLNLMGIDEIYCISVNDSFVMNSWAHKLNVKNIKVIPDGNGQFTRLMGMLIDKSHLGFGMRSWRYAFIANNLIIEKMFIEPGINDSGLDDDPYGETSPENIINTLKNETLSPSSS